MKGSTSTAGYRSVGAGAAGSAIILTAACTGLWAGVTGSGGDTEPVTIEITPADGTGDVRSNVPITVGAANGTITDVRVEQAGGGPDEDIPARVGTEAEAVAEAGDGDDYAMTGVLDKAKTEWVSDWNLVPGADVVVTATGINADGAETEVVSRFTTEPADKGKRLGLESNFPSSGQTVGVGMPVIVNFDAPVENKEQVENSIEVTSEKATQGAWNWFGDQMAVFRPEEYWEPDQKVSVNMRLAGVEASPGVVGTENRRLDFQVGREQITTVDDGAHEMTVQRSGKTVKTFPISNGRADTERYTTTNGVHLTMEKYEHLVMDSSTVGIPAGSAEAYRLDVNWAVRFSNSGEFAHAAPWNGNVGSANSSHGCTNMATDDAKWFHDETLMGDPYIVEGTDRELEVDNGWGFWQRSWDEWLENSPTGEPDSTDDTGTPGSVHAA
ncbi:Ig-like domain-containing protein [Nocardiopsis mangrovi]|uniref:Ig-like domain-containing protein n=1 Tax=Nocardiopsis mangrovi TaxID=1179818 RepID=A0ABV9DT41_9ACTN